MLTVIRNGKFTGVRYPEDKESYRRHHREQGDLCIWFEGEIADHHDENGNPVYREVAPEQLIAHAKAEKKTAIQEAKKQVRDSGVTVDSIRFDTDITARISYQEFAAKIAADPAYTVPDWKASGDVFVAMDAALYERISAAMEQLMGRVFTWQKDQNARVDAVSDPATAMEELEQISTTYTG
ncbi:MAG: hypothetical protein V6Z89_18730 [Desulfobacter sp.]